MLRVQADIATGPAALLRVRIVTVHGMDLVSISSRLSIPNLRARIELT